MTRLCAQGELDVLSEYVFANSTTIGIRINEVEKLMLPRTIRKMNTSHGKVRVKIATLRDGGNKWKVEHNDIVAIAHDSEFGYLELKRQIEQEVGVAMTREDNEH